MHSCDDASSETRSEGVCYLLHFRTSNTCSIYLPLLQWQSWRDPLVSCYCTCCLRLWTMALLQVSWSSFRRPAAHSYYIHIAEPWRNLSICQPLATVASQTTDNLKNVREASQPPMWGARSCEYLFLGTGSKLRIFTSSHEVRQEAVFPGILLLVVFHPAA